MRRAERTRHLSDNRRNQVMRPLELVDDPASRAQVQLSMRPRVIPNHMSSRCGVAHDRFMFTAVTPDCKECRRDVAYRKNLEKTRCPFGIRAVIECEVER